MKKAREAEEQAQQSRLIAEQSAMTEEPDTTYMANATNASGNTTGSAKAGAAKKKPGAKPKMSAKEKKERSVSECAMTVCLDGLTVLCRWRLTELYQFYRSSSAVVTP